jgi:hypothetical protein
MSNALRSPAPANIMELAAGRRNAQVVRGSRKAAGSVTYVSNLSANDTITINGVVFTAKAAGATGNQFNIGVDLSATLDAIVTKLNASVDPAVSVATYAKSGTTILTATYDVAGTAGNAFSLAASVGTVSGAKLAGGSDADKLDVKVNSAFGIVTAAGAAQALVLPNGFERGQTILVHLESKGAGASAVVSGVFAGGTSLTFDTLDEFALLYWTGAKWLPLINTGGVLA